ncbi:hypothetical protein KC19_5G080000 [Ceratodon purpureus]|uniref:Uncharacterized protein n=1 Tax=Ceratodon purpureus TaxID=3225 RepID=A0A8T0HZ31_CERPU|nr:hypothetical protein KC19_5G080000 [Ceratodon purpureus]
MQSQILLSSCSPPPKHLQTLKRVAPPSLPNVRGTVARTKHAVADDFPSTSPTPKTLTITTQSICKLSHCLQSLVFTLQAHDPLVPCNRHSEREQLHSYSNWCDLAFGFEFWRV